MRPVIWTFAAQRDVDNIYGYLAGLNPFAARRITAELYGAADILKRFPELGRPAADDTREWVVGKYVIVYETAPGETRVLRVWHGAQDRPGSRPPVSSR